MVKRLMSIFIIVMVVCTFAGCGIFNSGEESTEKSENVIEATESDENMSSEDATIDEAATEDDQVEEDKFIEITVFSPNDNVNGLIETKTEIIELNENLILEELIRMQVVRENTKINSFEHNEEGKLLVDFNEELANLLYSCGTSGEYVVMASIVNTYLSAYDADSFEFTINGEIFESGHVLYDEPLNYFNMDTN